jgi:hypothetical protein
LEAKLTCSAGGAAPLTPADESFTHQIVAPFGQTQYRSPAWGDRCYHLLHVDGLTVNAGRQLYVHDGRRYAFVGIADRAGQLCIRANAAYSAGADPDEPQVGPIRVAVLEPLRSIQIQADVPAAGSAVDLTFTARFPPVATDPHVVRQDGVVVTDYMNFFQSGYYNGHITLDGVKHEVVDRPGFRDRGWGLRKHEGPPKRGFVASLFCELPDSALYLILYETASGKRVFTNGWLLDRSGVQDTVTEAFHDLRLQGSSVIGAHYEVRFASGRRSDVEVDVVSRNYLAGIGYSADARFRTTAIERFDLTDPQTVALLDGQNDNGSTFRVDGVRGHGYLETGIGVHARYGRQKGTDRA